MNENKHGSLSYYRGRDIPPQVNFRSNQFEKSLCPHKLGETKRTQNKTLKKEALVKYGKYSSEAIQMQVTQGRNAMPAFGGRLSEAQIENVAAYVLQQADNGWK